ncbi:MAG: bifunctional phosphopantothenoylcysteine decarboxylase/phosphopantothenate--cysteine ligase CoaBC [Pseudomonadota bacterium]
MSKLQGQRVLLGVTGGIAAYKAADLVRRLIERGAEVRVVMTGGAMEFVGPLTFQALSGNPVSRDLLDEAAEAAMGHIELARWADRVLIAPATANSLAKLAAGLADDLLSTVCLASPAPKSVAPAMNQQMWAAAATQANVATLRERGYQVIGPGSGEQACGDVGPGRMVEPSDIADALAGERSVSDNAHNAHVGRLSGHSVLITAGPTREPIDPVRFISNHSSGKMGYAVAGAAIEAGAEVTLVSGPTTLGRPDGVQRILVESAADMHAAVLECASDVDIFIAAAAVADYAPASAAKQKMKKDKDELAIALKKNRDIVADVAALPGGPFTVGFAAETNDLKKHALGKLRRKGLDMIAANEVGGHKTGFNVDTNALHIFWDGGQLDLPNASKDAIAAQLIEVVCDRFFA